MIIYHTKKNTCGIQLIALATILLLFLFQNNVYAKSSANAFLIEPYLLEVDRNSATVAFHLENRMKATVLIFEDDSAIEFKSEKKTQSHFVKISGLQAGRTYHYQVVGGDGSVQTPPDDPTYQIRTACNKGESFSFIVFGDPRPGENLTHKHHQKVIDRAIQKEPAFSLVLGDMVDDGRDFELWRDFFSTEKALLRKAAIYPVIGDNDFMQGQGLVKALFPLLEKGYYHFEWGDVQFFALNAWDSRGFQSKKELDAQSEQVQWLESQLSKEAVQNSLYRIVFLHDPVLISRGYSSGVLKSAWEPVFKKYNVDIVFASWHMYERSQHNGVRYIISGGGGAELLWLSKNPDYAAQAEAKTHHFCKVDVQAGALTISAIDVNDTILDSLTISPKNKTAGHQLDLQQIALKVRQEIIIEAAQNRPFLPIHLFSYDSCSYCHQLLDRILPRLARQYQISLKVYFYDLELHETVYDLFLAAGADFGHQNTEIPTLFVGRRALGGEPAIENGLAEELSNFKQNPVQYMRAGIEPFQDPGDTQTIKENRFDGLSPAAVFGAGLREGAKPCGPAALIVLLSFLIATGSSRKTLISAGLLFVIAILAASVIGGLRFFEHGFSNADTSTGLVALQWTVLSGLLIAAAASVFDHIQRRWPGPDKMIPAISRLYQKIGNRVRLMSTNHMVIVPAALMTGVVFAGMEMACTGPVYIPIVTMISDPMYRAEAVGFLLLYNLAFIMPIAFVYLLVFAGLTSRKILCLNLTRQSRK
ncbi:hypothetical protein D1AOALGA4SA_10236 [Olavius algarvensis Delta 1 endosymbiont]|nr:hypothetical protein D1AOALGA4SA_10236 [Olavius algarvensis Delta 1 endosymbiont]